MAFSAIITLTGTVGIDVGPFNLYSNTNTYATAFETGVSRANLISGYTSNAVPTSTSTVRVTSTGVCTNYIDIPVTSPTPPASIDFTVNNSVQFPYPINSGNGSASGTITNNSGSTIYVYARFNSGGQTSGTIQGDSGTVAGGLALNIPGGPITGSGQYFYSTNYETLISNNTSVNWSLTKNDGFSFAVLDLAYVTTIGQTPLPFNY
jgi:hypothetical protein